MKTRRLLWAPLPLLVLLQLWRPSLSTPQEDAELSFYAVVETPQEVRDLLERSCADCHSARTSWPWYAHVTPVGQWLVGHVREGSRHFSLSRYGEYPERRQGKIFHELAHEVESGHMPLASYLWLHREAALEQADRLLLVDWAKAKASEVDGESDGKPAPEGD